MFPRSSRLTRSKDILAVLRSRNACHGKFLTLRWLLGGASQRFTVVVSTKVSKKATVRNRLKRQIRARLTDLRSTLPAPADYVAIVRPHTPLPTGRELAEDILAACTCAAQRSRT